MNRPQYGPQKLEPLEYRYEKNQKKYKEMGPTPRKKTMKLTSHTTSMDLMVEFPGNGMIPWQRFRPIPQLFVGASSKHGAQAFVTHREVTQQLQHVKQNCNWHGIQHNGLQGAHHLE